MEKIERRRARACETRTAAGINQGDGVQRRRAGDPAAYTGGGFFPEELFPEARRSQSEKWRGAGGIFAGAQPRTRWRGTLENSCPSGFEAFLSQDGPGELDYRQAIRSGPSAGAGDGQSAVA